MTPEAPMSSSADAGDYGNTSDAMDSIFDAPSTQQSAPEIPQQQTPEPEPETEYQAEDATEPVEAEAASDETIVDEDGQDEQFTDDAGRKYYNVKPDRTKEPATSALCRACLTLRSRNH